MASFRLVRLTSFLSCLIVFSHSSVVYAVKDPFFQKSSRNSTFLAGKEWALTREELVNRALDQAEKALAANGGLGFNKAGSESSPASLPANVVKEKPEWAAKMRPGFMSSSDSSRGYVDNMIPIWQGKEQLCYINSKISVSDGDACEQNIGVGYRQLCGNDSAILGCNVYYDNRRESSDERFEQVGVGAEVLSKWVDGRLNYYHPTTDPRLVGPGDTYGFSESALVRSVIYSEALSGFDYELGVMLPWVSDVIETRVYGGGYSYSSKKFDDVNGGALARGDHAVTILDIGGENGL